MWLKILIKVLLVGGENLTKKNVGKNKSSLAREKYGDLLCENSVCIRYNRDTITEQLRTPRRLLTMNGSVKKDKKTEKYFYIVDIGIDPLTGKRKQKKKRGFVTKKEAENALTMLLSEVHTGTYLEPSKLLYGEYLESWFNTKKHSVGIQTVKVLKGYLNSRIIPSLGNIKLAKLTTHCICKTTSIRCKTKV